MFILDQLSAHRRHQVRPRQGRATSSSRRWTTPRRCISSCSRRRWISKKGAIDEATFAKIEEDVLARIRELKENEQTGGIADATAFDDIEIEIPDDDRM